MKEKQRNIYMAALNQAIWHQSFPTQETPLTLAEIGTEYIVLYFYPRDNTPGCTNEANDFNDNLDAFNRLNTNIVGVSRDSVASHQRFVGKYGLQFPLIADEDETLCQAFDVIKEKNMYGKTHLGIERSTFLLSKEGEILKEWRKVKVKGHVDEVLEAIQAL